MEYITRKSRDSPTRDTCTALKTCWPSESRSRKHRLASFGQNDRAMRSIGIGAWLVTATHHYACTNKGIRPPSVHECKPTCKSCCSQLQYAVESVSEMTGQAGRRQQVPLETGKHRSVAAKPLKRWHADKTYHVPERHWLTSNGKAV